MRSSCLLGRPGRGGASCAASLERQLAMLMSLSPEDLIPIRRIRVVVDAMSACPCTPCHAGHRCRRSPSPPSRTGSRSSHRRKTRVSRWRASRLQQRCPASLDSLRQHRRSPLCRSRNLAPADDSPPRTHSDQHFSYWSGWRDLNPRPLDPQSSALPNCATARERVTVVRRRTASFGRCIIEGGSTGPQARSLQMIHWIIWTSTPTEVDRGEHDHQLEVPRRPVLARLDDLLRRCDLRVRRWGTCRSAASSSVTRTWRSPHRTALLDHTGGTPWRRWLKDRSLSRAPRRRATI